jgi:protein TonB
VTVFAASLVVHATLAVRLASAAMHNVSRRATSEVVIEMTRPPPPPVPVVIPPEASRPVSPSSPQPRLLRQASPKPAADAPPSDVSAPEGDEGTRPPASNPAPEAVAAPPAPPPPAPLVEAKEGANYLKNPRPAYPHLAEREGWQGVVLLRIQVQPDGRVGSVALQKSSGRGILDDAARSTVAAWTFVPATRGGIAIAGWVTVPIEFRLQ